MRRASASTIRSASVPCSSTAPSRPQRRILEFVAIGQQPFKHHGTSHEVSLQWRVLCKLAVDNIKGDDVAPSTKLCVQACTRPKGPAKTLGRSRHFYTGSELASVLS